MSQNLYVLAKKLGNLCIARNIKIALAESCTGGLVSSIITEVVGSSAWFNGAAVVYSNYAKENILGVSQALLRKYGAVSEETAKSMAEGALEKFSADVALSITGIAGPGGSTTEKSVGMVCFGLCDKNGLSLAKTHHFLSGREWIRQGAAAFVLEWMMIEISDRVTGFGKKIFTDADPR